MQKFNLEEVKEFIRKSSQDTKIYIGADSERFKRNGVWLADFAVAVVVHIDGSKGCAVFGKIDTERDYDQRKDRPATRLMGEVMRASQMYLDLVESAGDRKIEVHLDISDDVVNGSSCVTSQAIGYIRGTCNVVPMIKPDAPAASFAADRLRHIMEMKVA